MYVGGVFAGNIQRRRTFQLLRRVKNPLIIWPSSGLLFFPREAYFTSTRDERGEMRTTAHYEAPFSIFRVRKSEAEPSMILLNFAFRNHSLAFSLSREWPFVRVQYANALH